MAIAVLAVGSIGGCGEFLNPPPAQETHRAPERTDNPQSRPLAELFAAAADYARSQPTYAGHYLDRAGGDQMIFLFSGDADRHRDELARRIAPGLAWEVRSVPRPLAQLEALKDQVAGRWDELEALGIEVLGVGVDEVRNVVAIQVVDLTPQQAAYLADTFGPALVPEGQPWLADRPADTPVPPSVRQLVRDVDWRVLVGQPATRDHPVEVSLDRRTYGALWASVGQAGSPPTVDHDEEVVVALLVVVSPMVHSLDITSIEVDISQLLVYGKYRTPTGDCYTCSDMAAGYTFVVAIKRGALPTGRVTFRANRTLLSVYPEARAAEEATVLLP